MLFDCNIGVKEIPQNSKIIYREAVRAVIFSSELNLLLVHNSNGDYKFPGGGIKDGESHIEALKREVLEEIGINIKDNIKILGIIKEQRIDKEQSDAYFVMCSTYYQCFIDQYMGSVCLDEYEKDLSFKLKEINIFEAYQNNIDLFSKGEAKSIWIEREILALKHLSQYNDGSIKDE